MPQDKGSASDFLKKTVIKKKRKKKKSGGGGGSGLGGVSVPT